VRPVSLAGLSFQILKTPPGFEVVIDRQKIPKGGVLSLDIYSGTGKEKKIFIYHELSPKALGMQTPDV
jgi:oxalate decarboxylase/phosphoglucose isomerase-like protein (cupin superfamily)